MPTVTYTEVPGYVSCRDPRCPGHKERETIVTRQKQEFTYRELGGDLPGNEREAIDIVHQDEPCPVCDGPQVFSDEPRPEYAPISGQDQLALLNLNQSGQIQEAQLAQAQQAAALAEMRAAMAEQSKTMAEMQAELQRRKGGRPPKSEDASE